MRRAAPLLLVASSCTTQLSLTRDQLWAVAGLPSTGRRALYTDQGSFVFDGNLPVQVVTSSGPLPAAPLQAIRRAGDALVVSPPNGEAVEVARKDVVGGEAATFSASRSLGLAAAIAGAVAFVYVVLIGIAL